MGPVDPGEVVASPSQGAEWLPRPLALIAIAAAAAGLTIHSLAGIRGAYLSYASGVWLALARDLADHGVLFRDLTSDLGYGGTRYFPLFFLPISLLMKLGVPPVAAGFLTGLGAFALLAGGAHRVARAAGAPSLTAIAFAAAAAGPYFAIEAVFGIRADVMAAGWNLWGVGLLLPAWRVVPTAGRPRVGLASMCFVLAFATKVTAVMLPLALIAVAVLTSRRRLAAGLALRLLALLGAFLVIVQVGSAGRAFRVWAVCMFAGADSGSTLSAFLSVDFLPGLLNSHLVVAAGATALVTLVSGAVVRDDGADNLPSPLHMVAVALWISATLTLGITLSSPGTIPANQVIEWLAISLLTPAIVAGGRRRLRRAAGVVVAAILLWMAAQNVSRAWDMRPLVTRDAVLARQAFVDRVRAIDAPILVESALWPILAGREVVVPDPFAARSVLRSHPEIEATLIDEIDRRKYAAIVLEFDPASREGRGIYEFSHFSSGVMSAIDANYVLADQPLLNAFVFARRARPPGVDTPRTY